MRICEVARILILMGLTFLSSYFFYYSCYWLSYVLPYFHAFCLHYLIKYTEKYPQILGNPYIVLTQGILPANVSLDEDNLKATWWCLRDVLEKEKMLCFIMTKTGNHFVMSLIFVNLALHLCKPKTTYRFASTAYVRISSIYIP